MAWVGSIYNAYYDVHQLWDVYLQVSADVTAHDGGAIGIRTGRYKGLERRRWSL